MASALPPNFVDLNAAGNKINSEVHIMGVVTDFLPPGPSRGSDWMCSFSIIDPTYNGCNDEGLKVRFFRPMEAELPVIRGTGDVMLLRFLKIINRQGMIVGLSSRSTSWVLFPAASIPSKPTRSPLKLEHVKEPRAPVPTLPEMQYVITLCNSQDRKTFTERGSTFASTIPTPPSNGKPSQTRTWNDKFSLIRDVACDTYYDLVGQVVKIYSHSDRVELYLTDYTSNNLLFNYEWGQDDADGSGREGDAYNYIVPNSTKRAWPGPFGYMTLTVTLWPPHAYFGRQDLKENDYVHLRNVHIKRSKDAKLEGVLHSDRRYPDRIDVTILKHNENDERVKDVLRRKRDYAKKFQSSSVDFIAEARGFKRKGMEETKSLSRAQKKKRKQEREQLAKLKRSGGGDEHVGRTSLEFANLCQLIDEASLFKLQKHELNGNVNCSNHLITPRSLSSILSLDKHENVTPEGTSYTLPFQNINSRATVRVIDFFPSDLVDFAVPCPKSSEFDILSDAGDSEGQSESEAHSSCADSDEAERRWEWRFGLTVEDAMGSKTEKKATLNVYVVSQDAECLLKLDAEDLRKSPKALATLREKLFLLWGDLEEQKSRRSTALKELDGNSRVRKKEEAPKSKPFHCCLKEYGVKTKVVRSIETGGSEVADEEDGWVWQRRWRMFGTTII